MATTTRATAYTITAGNNLRGLRRRSTLGVQSRIYRIVESVTVMGVSS
jgi:hypothetical protein